jgi:hypothetical protein
MLLFLQHEPIFRSHDENLYIWVFGRCNITTCNLRIFLRQNLLLCSHSICFIRLLLLEQIIRMVMCYKRNCGETVILLSPDVASRRTKKSYRRYVYFLLENLTETNAAISLDLITQSIFMIENNLYSY